MNENKLRAAIAQNPVLVLLLGACPALAATTAVLPALTLGVTALAVMLLASLFSLAYQEAPSREHAVHRPVHAGRGLCEHGAASSERVAAQGL